MEGTAIRVFTSVGLVLLTATPGDCDRSWYAAPDLRALANTIERDEKFHQDLAGGARCHLQTVGQVFMGGLFVREPVSHDDQDIDGRALCIVGTWRCNSI